MCDLAQCFFFFFLFFFPKTNKNLNSLQNATLGLIEVDDLDPISNGKPSKLQVLETYKAFACVILIECKFFCK